MHRKVDRVKSFFGKPDRYILTGRPSIRIRTETVREFLQGFHFHSILDIGCGDGSLSIPLLSAANRLTLLDLSSGMLSIARSRVPEALRNRVDLVNQDFTAANLPERQYDLILCVGVLAHVDDPLEVVHKIARLIKPGGSVIVENADAGHLLSRLWRFRSRIQNLTGEREYHLNDLPHRTVLELFHSRGFTLVGTYRYSIGPPGMQKFLSQSQLYNGIRTIYGTAKRNRHASFGNEFLYHFRLPAFASPGELPS